MFDKKREYTHKRIPIMQMNATTHKKLHLEMLPKFSCGWAKPQDKEPFPTGNQRYTEPANASTAWAVFDWLGHERARGHISLWQTKCGLHSLIDFYMCRVSLCGARAVWRGDRSSKDQRALRLLPLRDARRVRIVLMMASHSDRNNHIAEQE